MTLAEIVSRYKQRQAVTQPPQPSDDTVAGLTPRGRAYVACQRFVSALAVLSAEEHAAMLDVFAKLTAPTGRTA